MQEFRKEFRCHKGGASSRDISQHPQSGAFTGSRVAPPRELGSVDGEGWQVRNNRKRARTELGVCHLAAPESSPREEPWAGGLDRDALWQAEGGCPGGGFQLSGPWWGTLGHGWPRPDPPRCLSWLTQGTVTRSGNRCFGTQRGRESPGVSVGGGEEEKQGSYVSHRTPGGGPGGAWEAGREAFKTRGPSACLSCSGAERRAPW